MPNNDLARRITASCKYRFRQASVSVANVDPVTRWKLGAADRWERLGSAECGWLVPQAWDVRGPVCYCIGAGQDVTFDVALAERYSADVVIMDPTPRAIDHVEVAISGKEIRFLPWALWSEDTDVVLYAPQNIKHVSHSIVNLQGTDRGFAAPARTLTTVMAEMGHESIDLLKIDIEGAEYAVLNNVLEVGVAIGIVNVEFDELSVPSRGAWRRIRQMCENLRAHGYSLERVDLGSNYTFVSKDYRRTAGI